MCRGHPEAALGGRTRTAPCLWYNNDVLLFAPSVTRCAAALLWFAACGNVVAPASDAAMPDAWESSCVLPVPLITKVESADPGYGNSCLHGSWNLQARNG